MRQLRRLAEYGPRLPTVRVVDLMDRSVVACTPDDTIRAVMSRMTRHRAHHIPVAEGGRLRGLVSLGDVVKQRLDDLETEANILREMSLAQSRTPPAGGVLVLREPG